MAYRTNLRELFIVDECRYGAMPIYQKDDGRICYLMAEGGESILAVSKPKRVIVPWVHYAGSKEYVEAAIQERLAALLSVPGHPHPSEYPGQILEKMKTALAPTGGLRAIVANEAVLKVLDLVFPPDSVPLYLPPQRMAAGVAYGIPENDLGRIVEGDVRDQVGMMVNDYVVAYRVREIADTPGLREAYKEALAGRFPVPSGDKPTGRVS
jgi:hypothetical protein